MNRISRGWSKSSATYNSDKEDKIGGGNRRKTPLTKLRNSSHHKNERFQLNDKKQKYRSRSHSSDEGCAKAYRIDPATSNKKEIRSHTVSRSRSRSSSRSVYRKRSISRSRSRSRSRSPSSSRSSSSSLNRPRSHSRSRSFASRSSSRSPLRTYSHSPIRSRKYITSKSKSNSKSRSPNRDNPLNGHTNSIIELKE